MLKTKSRGLLLLAYAQIQKVLRVLTAGIIGLSMVLSAYPMRAIAAAPPAPEVVFKLLAAGERSSVLAVTPYDTTTTHNGTEWYYNNYSIGFANLGSTINQNSADINDFSDPLRMSWHTDSTSLNSGWRLGDITGISSDEYARYIFEADTLPTYYPSGPQTNVNPSALTGWTLCYSGTYADSVPLSTIWTNCDGSYLLYAGAAAPFNKIDVTRNGTSVLNNIGGGHFGSPELFAGDSLNLSLYESDGTTPIVWNAYRVYVSNCEVGTCYPGSPISDSSYWDAGTVSGTSYTIPASAEGKHIAVLAADDVTGEPVNANWIKLEVERTPVIKNISDCEALENIGSTGHYEDTYVLTKNIDCSGIDFDPITWDASSDFRGTFDGDGYKISNLTIDRPEDSEVGLFQETQDAVIKDLILENSNITGYYEVGTIIGEADNTSITNVRVSGTVTGPDSCDEEIGGIVGDIDNDEDDNKLDRIYFSGTVTAANCDQVGGLIGSADEISITRSGTNATVSGDDEVGGLIGWADETTNTESYARGDVNGDTFVGGLIGRQSDATTSRSYATGNVTGDSWVGGLVGRYGTVSNSYATGSVTGDNSVGGLVGACTGSTIIKSYSIGVVTGVNVEQSGGLVGYNEFCNDTANYWDTETSTQESSAAGSGKTTAEMKTLATFTPGSEDWDFESIWSISADYNNGYPCLQWDETVCAGDGDNISYEEEDFAPNSGDANNDGTPDSAQKHVTAYVNSVSSKYVAVETDSSCDNSQVGSSAESASAKDAGYDYAQGLLNFTADCGTPGFTTTVKLYYYGVSKADLVLRKFKPATSAYFNVAGATMTESTVDGRTLTTVTYSVTDGGELDLDGAVNGIIVDPVGVANAVVGPPNTGVGGLLRIRLY